MILLEGMEKMEDKIQSWQTLLQVDNLAAEAVLSDEERRELFEKRMEIFHRIRN